MSTKLVGIVLESALPRPEKYLLIALADHAKEDGSDVYPSLLNMEWKLGYSERQLRRLLLNLERSGVLYLVHRGGAGPGDVTKYRICPDKIPMLEPFRQWAMKRRIQGRQNVTLQGGHFEHEKGGHFVQKKAVKMSVESKNYIEPRTREEENRLFARQAAQNVIQFHRQGKPSDDARRELGRRLGTMSADVIDAFIKQVEKDNGLKRQALPGKENSELISIVN